MDKFFYKTLSWIQQYEIPKIKWSRFIATSFFIENKESAEKHIEQIKKKYHDATHNCYAYRYGTKINFDLFGNLEITPENIKQNDDWEPTSTAGKPILSVVQGEWLHNILIVVTRYFWWTMLGVGGLIQAYTNATKWLIQKSKLSKIEIVEELNFAYETVLTSTIMNLINKYDVQIKQQNFIDDKNNIICIINKAYLQSFKKDVLDGSKGLLKL